MRVSAALVLSAITLVVSAAPQAEQVTKVPPAPTLPLPTTLPTKEPPAPTLPPPTKEPPAPTLPPSPTKEPPAPTLPPAPTSTHPTPTKPPTSIVDPPPPSSTVTVVNPTIIDPPPSFAPVQCICPKKQKLLCCKAVISSLEDFARERLKVLGVQLEGVNVPVGVGCVPYEPITFAQEGRCPGEVVCCQDSRKPEVAAVGCAAVSI